jgi:putative tryptophan/tyrosine transport system substrate-binding protein
MGTKCTLFLILLSTYALPAKVSGTNSTAGDRPTPIIAMITWRGETDAERGFVKGMRQFKSLVSFIRYHADQDIKRLKQIIFDIRYNKSVDLIYVFGTTATQNVLREIHDIPVVFNIVNRPVAAGIIQSWESSGNNATGASNQVPVKNQLKALRKVVKFKRLAIIYNPREANSRIQRDIAWGLQNEMGFVLEEFKITYPSDMPAVMPQLKGNLDAVFIPADSLMVSLGDDLASWLNTFKLASLASVESMVVEQGLLLGLQPSFFQLGLIVANKAKRILNGKSPSDIPTAQGDYFYITINMKTAQKIDIQIPISILVMANKIIR